MKKKIIIISISIFLLTACSTGTNAEKPSASNTTGLNETTSNEMINSVFVTEKGKIELEKRALLSDRLEILIPKEFVEMPEEMAKLKYPSEYRPPLIFTGAEEESTNILINHTNNIFSDEQIAEDFEYLKESLMKIYPSATLYSEGVEKIKGKNVGKIEILTPAIDTNIYNLICFLELDGQLLMCSFNTTEDQMKDWKPIGNEIMKSITIN